LQNLTPCRLTNGTQTYGGDFCLHLQRRAGKNVWMHPIEGPCLEDDDNFEVFTAELMKISVSCDVGVLLDHLARHGQQGNTRSWYQSTRHHVVEGWL